MARRREKEGRGVFLSRFPNYRVLRADGRATKCLRCQCGGAWGEERGSGSGGGEGAVAGLVYAGLCFALCETLFPWLSSSRRLLCVFHLCVAVCAGACVTACTRAPYFFFRIQLSASRRFLGSGC